MNKNSNYTAVIFDLFGTLVGTFSTSKHDLVLKKMAKTLGVDYENFAVLFDYDMRNARELGEFSTIEENIEIACKLIDANPTKDNVKRAAKYRVEFTERSLHPRGDAIQTIKQIKSKGCTIGLISDCSPEVPYVWLTTPFAKVIDVAVFSCAVCIKKPDQRIYQIVCDELGVAPNECLYIGDGDSAELEGAIEAGMEPVLIRVKGEDDYDRDRPSADGWKGERISSLTEALNYV